MAVDPCWLTRSVLGVSATLTRAEQTPLNTMQPFAREIEFPSEAVVTQRYT